MKKLFIIALVAAGVAPMSAQDCKSLYEQGKALDDAFNKEKPTMLDPQKQPSAEASAGLLKAYDLFMQAMECEKVPNAKGKVENKLTKKIEKALKAHSADMDYNKAAIALFNANMRYPEAYTAFMLSGAATRELGTVADSVYAVDFYNAGNSAFGSDFAAAAKAYSEARKANTTEPMAYVYNIASLQQMAQADSTFEAKAADEIFAVASEGVERFGASNDFIFGNYIQHFLDASAYDEALAALAKCIANEPNNANIYRLRAIVNNAQHQYANAVPDFKKVAELSDNYEYVRDASNNINNIAKFMMGQINNATPEQKTQILDFFNSALQIANKAKAMEGADAKIDSIIEDINYNIENANKL